jgi:hypothetical protein
MVDVIEVLTLAAGVITALGVFAGPYLAEHLRAGRLSRRGHYEKIKEECLTPLSSTVAGLLASYFAPSESVPSLYLNDSDKDIPVPKPKKLTIDATRWEFGPEDDARLDEKFAYPLRN